MMRAAGKLRKTAVRFAGDRNGKFAVLFGVLVLTLALSAGFAVNTAQLVNAKSTLRGATDAAVTSTARDLTTGIIKPADVEATVRTFLDANSAGGILPDDQIVLDKLTVDLTAKTIEIATHVDVPYFFPLFSEKVGRVSTVAAAIYSDRKIKVAVMLDVAGPMAGQKIKDRRTAATNTVDAAVKDVPDNNGKATPRIAATTLCAAMRDHGVGVFTVGFALTEKNAQSTQQSCAGTGSVNHFYQAANGAEPGAAFQPIARNIGGWR